MGSENWEPEVGLLDDFDAVIRDAYFEINEDYKKVSGSEDPMLTFDLDSPDLDKPMTQGWTCGASKEWKIDNGGKSVISGTRPDSTRFNSQSRAGLLVGKMIVLIGDGDKGKGQDFFSDRGLMNEAKSYIGLNFHWKREPMDVLGSGEKRDVLMPVAYLGLDEAAVKASSEVDFTEHYAAIVTLAKGLDSDGLKKAILGSSLNDVKGLTNQVFNKGLIPDLERINLLEKDENGKYK